MTEPQYPGGHGEGSPLSSEDKQHLKKYVKEHPDNKMAWYLLGREYAAKGEQAKANYCYAQAGEVFEAFERKPNPVAAEPHVEPSQKALTAKGSSQREPIKRLARITAAVVLFIVMSIPVQSSTNHEHVVEAPAYEAASAQMKGSVTRQGNDRQAAIPQDQQVQLVYSLGQLDNEKLSEKLSRIAFSKPGSPEWSVMVEGKVADNQNWINWAAAPTYVLTARKSANQGTLSMEYHSAESCNCKAAKADEAKAVYRSWSEGAEQQAILLSSLAAYKRIKGREPESISQLAGDYPNNFLPGFTPWMETSFKHWMLLSTASKLAPVWKKVQNPKGEKPAFLRRNVAVDVRKGPLSDPIEIVIDKTNHRLAVVSGRIILRNYAIGIGNKRTPTPEGTFQLTEKVKNPNGKTDGDFGTRGMTLSGTLYAIHGTNEPQSIGKDVSKGCIRMNNKDIEQLYDMAPLGTKVTIRQGGLPKEFMHGEKAFRLPAMSNETNPKKSYHWLN